MIASNDYAVMLLATYRPRSDAAARGYDSWLRETATPFFNAQPEVVRYSAWRVVASRGRLAQCAAGAEESFEHFACFGLHSRDDVKTLLVREEVLQFVSDWTREWSIRPAAENRAENLFLTVCQRLRTNGGATAQHLAFVPFANRATPDRAAFVAWAPPEHQAWLAGLAAGTRYESWSIVERLFGDLQPEYFDLIYLPDATEWPALAEVVTTVALGERLAGPPS